MSVFNLFKKRKTTVSLKKFSEQVAEIATKYNKNHWVVKCEMNAFNETRFSGYVASYWTKDYPTAEEVLDDLTRWCGAPTEPQVKEVII